MIQKILQFENNKIDPTIISNAQVECLVSHLLKLIENNVGGDVVELGCYVGESSKYLMKTLVETKSDKRLFVYDSFEGLPDLSEWETNTGWKPRTLNTSEDVLISNFIKNNLPLPIIHKDWFKNIPDYRIPEKICFAFLDGDFYDSIHDSLSKIYDRVVDGGVICFHDYNRPDLPGVKGAIENFFHGKGVDFDVIEETPQLGVFVKKKQTYVEVKKNYRITLVTGLWDLGRDKLQEGWSRPFSHYLSKLENILSLDVNLIIFGDEDIKDFVFERRSKKNTQFILRKLDWFKNNDYYELIQNIRKNPDWYNQSGWLSESTQSKLEMYNPLVMSKVFLLHDAKIMDFFDSTHLFWIDAGLTNTVHLGYFSHDKVLDKIVDNFKKINFICFPYDGKVEIHGFKYDKMCQYSGSEVEMVARGGFFGGEKEYISELNTLYYSLLINTLSNGYMGTEESLFTILTYKHPDLINYYEIENNGLLNTFFENVKTNSLVKKTTNLEMSYVEFVELEKIGLYVITFNSPNQLRTLIESMKLYDTNFLTKTRKVLLNNSTDLSTTPEYEDLCNKYGFEHIKKDNLGICGGRQWIAEHADSHDLDGYWFSEDDMFFQKKEGESCRNGFLKYVPDFYRKTLEIVKKENFDFLKINFTEFFGDNSTQWSWYNVPQDFREKNWPQKPKLPSMGLDPNAPKTVFKNIKSYEGIPYATGEIYYCNWTQFVTREGNKKMFLDTKFAHPFENTWMSFMYQETIKGNLNPGILLMTPIEHNRFDHYDRNIRREN